MLSKKIQKILSDFKVDKKYWKYSNLTNEEQELRRSKPTPYLKCTIEIAKELNLKNVVELGSSTYAVTQGCLDYFYNFNNSFLSPQCCIDGHSTFFFTKEDFNVYSVDIDENRVNSVLWSYNNLNISVPDNLKLYIPMDAFEFVENFNQTIDLLYLDAWEIGSPNCAENYLNFFIKIQNKLAPTHLILINDTDFVHTIRGKDHLLTPYLIDNGYKLLFNGRQTLFLKEQENNLQESSIIKIDTEESPKTLINDRLVILTMSTIPNRLNSIHTNGGLKPVLDVLLNLSYSNYELHLNIPYYNVKSGQEYIIPSWLENYDNNKLKIFRTDDYGSITKLIPTIDRISDPETIIITVDDDLNYMDGFIEYHLIKRNEYSDCAIGFAGMGAIDGTCHFCTTMNKDVRVKILEGYKTISYKRSFFDTDFKDFAIGNWNDDMIISAYLGKNNIKKYVISYSGDTDFNPRVESFPILGHIANESGGCSWFRTESVPDNHNIYYKLGYLER